MNEDPLEAIEIAVMLAEQAGTGVTLTPAQGRWLLAEIDALKSEIELLRVELGNRPSPGQKPVDVWPDRW